MVNHNSNCLSGKKKHEHLQGNLPVLFVLFRHCNKRKMTHILHTTVKWRSTMHQCPCPYARTCYDTSLPNIHDLTRRMQLTTNLFYGTANILTFNLCSLVSFSKLVHCKGKDFLICTSDYLYMILTSFFKWTFNRIGN